MFVAQQGTHVCFTDVKLLRPEYTHRCRIEGHTEMRYPATDSCLHLKHPNFSYRTILYVIKHLIVLLDADDNLKSPD